MERLTINDVKNVINSYRVKNSYIKKIYYNNELDLKDIADLLKRDIILDRSQKESYFVSYLLKEFNLSPFLFLNQPYEIVLNIYQMKTQRL